MRLRVYLAFAALGLPSLRGAAGQQPTAVDAVRRLYRQYEWETADSSTAKRPLFAASPAELRTYLDSGLVAAVLADRACQAREQGICNLDFEPMWDSQDPGGATVEVEPTPDATVVRARIHYASQHETRLVTYRLRRTASGWRIADMAGVEWPSLLRLLRKPVSQ